MPVGKELGNFEGKFTSVRTVAINGEEVVTEGSYMGKVSGQLGGTVTGTATFTGTTGASARGTMTALSVGYLDCPARAKASIGPLVPATLKLAPHSCWGIK